MKKNKHLIPHPEWEKVNFTSPEVKDGLAKKVLTEITNALQAHAYLDKEGHLWVSSLTLPHVLRTNKHSADYILSTFNKNEVTTISGIDYVRGYSVIGRISKEIEDSGLKKRGNYLRFSEECLLGIRDSDQAKALRGEYEEYWREEKKKLKKLRIKKFGILKDELTGDLLDKKTAQFSHIRSVNMFKSLALKIENGLIVNSSTHAIITDKGVITENDLVLLCKKKGWKTEWVKVYFDFLESEGLE
jgi:hypothetical protein